MPSQRLSITAANVLEQAKQFGLETPTVHDLARLAEASDQQALNLLANGGAVLGRGLGTLSNMLDPQAVVLGGSLALSNAIYRQAVRAGIRETVWPPERDAPQLLIPKLNSDAGLVGAALIA